MLNTKPMRQLSMSRDRQRALLKNLATHLVLKEKITTTKTLGKELVPFFERLIEISKKPTLANQRRLIALVDTHEAAQKLYRDLGQRFAKRTGGYVSLKANGWRRGDNTRMATLSLTEDKIEAKQPQTERKTPKKAKA